MRRLLLFETAATATRPALSLALRGSEPYVVAHETWADAPKTTDPLAECALQQFSGWPHPKTENLTILFYLLIIRHSIKKRTLIRVVE